MIYGEGDAFNKSITPPVHQVKLGNLRSRFRAQRGPIFFGDSGLSYKVKPIDLGVP